MRNIICSVIILVIVISCDKSDRPEPENIEIRDYQKILDNYFVTSIAFDKLGNAWIGTFHTELIKYNSADTIVFDSNNSVLPSSGMISDIAIDSKNNIWIACDKLIKYDGHSFTAYNDKNLNISKIISSPIAIDSKDNIWFVSKGVVNYDGTTFNFFESENSKLPGKVVYDIAIDRNDVVWLSENGKNVNSNDCYIVKISDDDWTIYGSNELGFTPYYLDNIRTNSKNQVCGNINYSFSSEINDKGPKAFIFDGHKCEMLYYRNDSTKRFNLLSISRDDKIRFGGNNGAYYVYDGINWFMDDTTFKSIFAIEQSNDGKIWIGTGNGIFILN
jgi:ligand-binding sensor domain-containing protein